MVVPVAAGARAQVPARAGGPAQAVAAAAEQVVEDLAGLQRFKAPPEPHVSYLLRFHHMVHKEMDGGWGSGHGSQQAGTTVAPDRRSRSLHASNLSCAC